MLDEQSGEVETIRADRLVLATGGCGKVYLYTTESRHRDRRRRGNCLSAAREMHRRTWSSSNSIRLCLSSTRKRNRSDLGSCSRERGNLAQQQGPGFHGTISSAGLACAARRRVVRLTRKLSAQARSAFISISRTNRASFCRSAFRTFTRPACNSASTWRKQPIPVVPAAHYQCGECKTDLTGATSLPGLYAIGEVACDGTCTGRTVLRSNSLLEGLVGWRIGLVKRWSWKKRSSIQRRFFRFAGMAVRQCPELSMNWW